MKTRTQNEINYLKATYKRLNITTQEQIDAQIARYIDLGDAAEARRDAAEYESKTYWHHHDVAMKWFELARRMMPAGS